MSEGHTKMMDRREGVRSNLFRGDKVGAAPWRGRAMVPQLVGLCGALWVDNKPPAPDSRAPASVVTLNCHIKGNDARRTSVRFFDVSEGKRP